MIRHVVLFKHKPTVTQEERDAWIASALAMGPHIPYVHNLTAGYDLIRSARAYDVALVCDFESLDDVRRYAEDPVHVPVATRAREMSDHICSVDFEF